MSLSAAMLVGFTGITSNQATVDTVGDNLANSNTTGFKSQRTLFETLLYRTISEGQGPGGDSFGTLPTQIGSGSTVATIQRNFEQGSIESTGFAQDLAINGKGFFILGEDDGANVYTRDGSFRLDADSTMVSVQGRPVQVFPADEDENIQTGTLSDLVIPLGSSTAPVATGAVDMDGHLDVQAALAATGAAFTSGPLTTGSGALATATTPLTDLVDAAGIGLFATGDELQINVRKGGIDMPESTFVVGTTGGTLGDLASHLESVLGIETDPATGGDPGVTVTDGALIVRSNLGESQAVQIDGTSIRNASGTIAAPFLFTQTEVATGDGVITSFNVFDSLGNPVELRLRFALESRTTGSTTWRYYAESVDDTDLSPALGTGTITFDESGRFLGSTGADLTIDRVGTGAAQPLSVALDFSSLTGHAAADGSSAVIMASQDGVPSGVMIGFEVDSAGIVTASYSNQRTQILGQIAMATFANEAGLLGLSQNVFDVGPNSGTATILAPESGVAGSIVSSALEQSNVEIAREFINLITASTGITASSRVVRTADDLLQELLLLAR